MVCIVSICKEVVTSISVFLNNGFNEAKIHLEYFLNTELDTAKNNILAMNIEIT